MKRSLLIAILFAVAAGAWVLSGQFGESANSPEIQKPPAELEADVEIPQVRVRRQTAERYAPEEVLNGRTEALHEVDLKAETKGRVVSLDFERGDSLEKGQTIVTLDPEDRPERLAEARALLQQRQLEYEVATKLKDKGFRPDTEVAGAKAALETAKAQVRLAEIEQRNTQITAPFAGVAEDRMVELGDYVEPGDTIARVVDLDPILIVAQVNEQKINQIKVGGSGQARLTGGQEVAGRVRFVASMAEPQTRTFRVELEVPNPDSAIPDGISAELRLPLAEQTAHKVSPAILTLNDEGRIGVMLLEEGKIARFTPVSIVDSGLEGVWLSGLPDEATFITVGQEFITDGQEVRALDEETLEPLAAPAIAGGEAKGGTS